MENLKRQGFGVYAYDTNTMQYMKAKSDTGVYVTKVVAGTAAEKAGLQRDDIILSIDGQKLERMCELRRYVYTKKPKDEVMLRVLRDGRVVEMRVKLGSR